MKLLVLGSILLVLIAVPCRPAVFTLAVDDAVDCVGGDPPLERYVVSTESECSWDLDCDSDGDFCDNSWGTECTSHHMDQLNLGGYECVATVENTECHLWHPLRVCKLRAACGFDEDENCVLTNNTTSVLSSSDCITFPGL